jgi:GNAT superfamily N-acetyltransferase
MTDVEIRPARVEDAAEIARVHVESWQVAYADVFPAAFLASIDVEARRRLAVKMLKEETPPTLVADVDGRIAGFVSFGESRDDDARGCGEVYAIYVAPESWRLGLGRELLRHAEETLLGAGFRAAMLWVLEENPRARRFYEAMGWTPDGKSKQIERGGVETAEIRYRRNL